MDEERLRRVILGCMATLVFITAITIAAEYIAALKDWLKAWFFHHWVGKGVLALVVFIIFAFVIRLPAASDIRKLVNLLTMTVVVCGLAILLFFVWHFYS